MHSVGRVVAYFLFLLLLCLTCLYFLLLLTIWDVAGDDLDFMASLVFPHASAGRVPGRGPASSCPGPTGWDPSFNPDFQALVPSVSLTPGWDTLCVFSLCVQGSREQGRVPTSHQPWLLPALPGLRHSCAEQTGGGRPTPLLVQNASASTAPSQAHPWASEGERHRADGSPREP